MDELHNLVKGQAEGFEIHKVHRDSVGKEKYLKMEKDEFLTQTNVQKLGQEVAIELSGKNWEEKYEWVNNQREEGNKIFKKGIYDQAIDTYLKALCGMDFGKQDEDQEERVNKDLKAPILNNIALCLIKQNKFMRSNQMLDQVLKVDPENFKAWTRKVQNFLKIGDTEEAKKTVTDAEKQAVTLEDKALITGLYKEIAQQTLKEKNFSKNIFANKLGGLYQDKPDYSKMEEFMQEYENEYLASLSNTQWFLYPFLKTARVVFRKLGLCRDKNSDEFKNRKNNKVE
ncbi:tpr domain containing protein [Stylonychia lemnae]|uniref:Tpr domain containing protein n=1 Tax=Stylonychia lemnae TaxID=5949 RepID=A0A078A2I0_STYLE|nr:tpr domain containing protein [Stylonychia lemnae]|eukprot:CDW76411.1 tpr domain containing protein [Stylonychia lemnae]